MNFSLRILFLLAAVRILFTLVQRKMPVGNEFTMFHHINFVFTKKYKYVKKYPYILSKQSGINALLTPRAK